MDASEINTLVKRAIDHQKSGRAPQAEKLFQQALALQPDHCAALHFLGLLCQQRGNDAAALDLLRRSVLAAPGSEQAHYHNNLATGFGRAGRFDEALAAIERALVLKPDYAEAYGNKGVIFDKQGKLEEARLALAKAIELKPAFGDAQVNLGNVLTKMGRDKEALEHLEQAAERFPKDAVILLNLGNALRRCGRIDAAIASLRRAVERRPDSPEARNNLGVALHDAGMLADAEAELRKAIDLKQSYADAHWNLSLVLLHKGDFHNGWLEYEWRRHLKEDAISKRNFPQPPWSGGPLEGRRILVLCEQGLGDTLQFIRYAQVLAQCRLTNINSSQQL
jgi:Flp pilus assembly protein TadD